MGLYNKFNRNVILPLSDRIFGRSISSSLQFLEESQWWDKDQITTFQNEKLQEMIQYAYREIPFYKELYDRHGVSISQIQTTDDLSSLPVIQKQDIRDIAKSRRGRSVKVIKGISSGSTGEPLQYTKSIEAYSFHTATGIRAWSWMGFSLGDKYIKVSQNPRSSLLKRWQDRVNRSLYVFLKDINDEEFEKLYRQIIKYRPDYLRSYPDPLYFFCKYIERKGYHVPPLKGINTTGNILYPQSRHFIEETLKTKVYDAYSCEGGAIFAQTGRGDNYFGADEYAITEIINEDGVEVNQGKKGRLVTTDLWNTEVPFIRYDTQDIVTKANASANSKRGLTQIEGIDGRDCDILVTPDGRLVIVHIFTIFFEWLESVDQFQAIQEEPDLFRILLVVNDKFTKSDKNRIETYWTEYFGKEARVEIEIVDEIKPRKSGKRSFLVRDENIPLPV